MVKRSDNNKQNHEFKVHVHKITRGEILAAAAAENDSKKGEHELVFAIGNIMHVWRYRKGEKQNMHMYAQKADEKHALEIHADDIIQIKAIHRKGQKAQVISASEDNLVQHIIVGHQPEKIDGLEAVEGIEDEWIAAVCNAEAPVKRAGAFGSKMLFFYIITQHDTLQLWNAHGERIAEFEDIRSRPHCQYLLDCHYDQLSQRLFLACTSTEGHLTLFHVNENELQIIAQVRGHTAAIRDIAFTDCMIFTGGEDRRICAWTFDESLVAPDVERIRAQIDAEEIISDEQMINDPDTAPHTHLPDGSCCREIAQSNISSTSLNNDSERMSIDYELESISYAVTNANEMPHRHRQRKYSPY